MNKITFVLTLGALMLVAQAASATNILTNGSFENGTLYSGTGITGWTYNNMGSGGTLYEDTRYLIPADGSRALSDYSTGIVYQDTGTTVQADTTYTFSVEIADMGWGRVVPNLQVDLWNGNPTQTGVTMLSGGTGGTSGLSYNWLSGTSVPTYVNPDKAGGVSTPQAGAGWVTLTLTYTTPDSGGGVGSELWARIEAAGSGDQCFLDNAILTATPEPATMILLGLGGLLLRKRA
jgi:hypothetical protein